MVKTITILFWLFSVNLYGQPNVVFDQLTYKDGLSFNDIIDITKDSKGFMWFATENGLNRYNAYEFKQFMHHADDSTSLGYNNMRAILEDHQGFIWIGHLSGVSRFDPANHLFKNYSHDIQNKNSLSNDFIQSICETDDHKIWMGTAYGGISVFDPASESFTRFKHDSENDNSLISNNWIYDIHQDRYGKIWIATQEGLEEYDPITGEFQHHLGIENYDPPWQNPVTKSSIYSILEDTIENCLWVGKTGSIAKYNLDTKVFINYLIGDEIADMFSLCTDGHGGLYASGFRGLYHFKKEHLNKEIVDLRNIGPIDGGRFRRIYRDNFGTVWVAGRNGVYIIDDNKLKVDIYLTDQYVKSIDTDGEKTSGLIDYLDEVFIATQGLGLRRLNLKNGAYKSYRYSTNKNSLSGDFIWEIFKDQYGIIWIGSTPGGLDKFDPNSEMFINYRVNNDNGPIISDKVSAIFEDSDSNLWIGYFSPGLTKMTMNGEQGFEREPISSQHYITDQENPNLGVTFEFEEDQFGNIWAAKMNGLFKFNHDKLLFTKQPLTNSGKENVFAIHLDGSGQLWVGSDLGLFKATTVQGFEQKDSVVFKRFYENQIPMVANIMEDGQGNLWMVTAVDIITRVSMDSLSFKDYDFDYGLSAKYANLTSSYRDEYGNFFIPRGFGFMVFHPDSITTNPNIPPVVFTNFQLSGKSISIKDSLGGKPVLNTVIDEVDQITLPYGQNFTFEFAALNYTDPEKNQYSYKLEGFDENWSPPSTSRTAAFTNLWEGHYILRVRGSNNDGVWNKEGAAIKITILPPWYRGKIAWIIYGGLLVFALVWARKIIVVREREKARHQLEHLELKKAQEMDQMKTRFFTNISHEFRTPLTLILGPLKQMYEGTFTGDSHTVIGVMIRNSKRLLHLINQLLDFSKLESGKVKLQASVGDLVEFVRTMFAAFESTAQSRKIRYVFQSDVSSLPTYYDRDKLQKVITNLLGNAFKFTDNGGSIEIHMTRNIDHSDVDKGEGVIEISIRDNGKGIPEEKLPRIFDRFYQADESSTRQQEGTGIGLALARELVELHHGSIKATGQKGDGTTFIIHLPIGRSHLEDSEVVVRKGYQEIDTSTLETLPIQAIATDEPVNGDENLPLVLIIDDNEDMRLYLREVLAGRYRLTEAADGEKGWDSAHENSPDLVLSDVMMPEMDGHELCQKLKTDEHTSHIPVILLTARAGEKAKLEGLETGADDYVTKPFSAEELRARIHNLIEIRQKLREQFSKSLSLEPKDLAITSADGRFLQRAMDILEIHRSDASFSVEAFIKEIGMSNTQLHRKLKALTDQSASEFIRSYRLKYARQLIQKDYGNMAQVAYECGFNNPSYFAECFKKQFGILPSEFAKANH